MRSVSAIALLLVCPLVSPARAHFIWVQAQSSPAGQQASVWFSESPEPGSADLIEKIRRTTVTLRQAAGESAAVETSVARDGDQGALRGAFAPAGPYALEASCDYGSITRGEETFHLYYYAKHLAGREADDLTRLADHGEHALNILPRRVAGKWQVQVLFRGKPAPQAEVVVHAQNGNESTPKLNSSGCCTLPEGELAGLAVRAGCRETIADAAGAGQSAARHYATLTFGLPAGGGALSAADVLRQARAGRAVWKKFRGFSGSAVVRINGVQEQGTISVDGDGVATTSLANERLRDWVETQLQSLVQHRLPSNDGKEQPTFAEEPNGHPLGRLIRLGDERFQSAYRIRDGVVTEVNRRTGDTRFTISVLDVTRNAEREYLPHVVSLSTWDNKAGTLLSSQMVTNTWQRVENWDLPRRILEVYTSASEQEVRELELRDLKVPAVK